MKQICIITVIILSCFFFCSKPVDEREYHNPADKYSDSYVNPVIVKPTEITLSENGGTGNFSVVLNLAPDDDVVINIENLDASEVTVDKDSLVFTPQNWNVEQTVNLTGMNDSEVDSDQETTIKLTVNALLTKETAVGYSLIKPGDIKVTVLDDDDNIGDVGPAGGYIFYDKGSYSNGWRYLEVAPSDQNNGSSTAWGVDGIEISGADGTAVGTGEQNTIDIVNGCGTVGIAARICYDLNLGGYDDWFLPSKDELNLMYVNLHLNGVGGFAVYDNGYWSSLSTAIVMRGVCASTTAIGGIIIRTSLLPSFVL